MITPQALIDKFKYALSNKWGYIWGTAGVKWTQARQTALNKTTDSNRANGRKYGSKWIGHYVADCSGLFTWAFKQLGGTMYHGSDTMYKKWCTNHGQLKKGKRSDGKELKPGTAVFVWNGKTYSHVGLFVGGDVVVEAMGTQNGVTTSKVSASKWTYWGELKGVDFGDTVQEPVQQTTPPQNTVEIPITIRKGSSGVTVTKAQNILHKLGYDLGPYGIDGKFGAKTEAAIRKFQKDHNLVVDGIVGKNTWTALFQENNKLQ